MKAILLLCIAALFTYSLNAQFNGPFNPATVNNVSKPGSSVSWTYLKNVKESDNKFSAFGDIPGPVGSYTDYIVATNFNFNIPVGSNITGIVVEVQCVDPNAHTSDYSVHIVKNGVMGEVEKATGSLFPNTDNYLIYGNPHDLWGESWSSILINSPDFGVAFAAQKSSLGPTSDAGIDHIRITVYYNFFTLPVQLTSFSAAKNNKSIKLNWATSNETSMDHFEVERSADGRIFHSISSIQSRNQNSSYTCIDNNPFNGVSYYRLKMVGTNSEIKYSKIVSIDFKSNEFNLYPSLLNKGENIYITNPFNNPLQIHFFNSSGNLVSIVNTSSNQVLLSRTSLFSGIINYKVYNQKQQEVGRGQITIQ
jgi:hypothetical protein